MADSSANVFTDIQGEIAGVIDALSRSPIALPNTSESGDELLDPTVEAAAHLAAAHRIVGELASRWEVDQRFGRVPEARIGDAVVGEREAVEPSRAVVDIFEKLSQRDRR